VSDAGDVGNFEFIEANVRSRAKLSYYGVDRYLSGDYDELMSHATPLEALYQVYQALRKSREEHELVMEDRREYRWILNDKKQIDHVEPSSKLLSQKVVEECMVAANRCAARFLAEKKCSGPFVSHPGFRRDRLKEAQKFLERSAPEVAELNLDDRKDYRAIMQCLSSDQQSLPLRGMVNRLLTRATLSTEPSVHMGMSLDA
jgi:exoribonuclease II